MLNKINKNFKNKSILSNIIIICMINFKVKQLKVIKIYLIAILIK